MASDQEDEEKKLTLSDTIQLSIAILLLWVSVWELIGLTLSHHSKQTKYVVYGILLSIAIYMLFTLHRRKIAVHF
jgi:hypothetical protein